MAQCRKALTARPWQPEFNSQIPRKGMRATMSPTWVIEVPPSHIHILMATLGCPLNSMWNQLISKLLDTSVRDFLSQVIWSRMIHICTPRRCSPHKKDTKEGSYAFRLLALWLARPSTLSPRRFFTNIRTHFFGIPTQTETPRLSRDLQAPSTRPGLLRQPAPWTEQLLLLVLPRWDSHCWTTQNISYMPAEWILL